MSKFICFSSRWSGALARIFDPCMQPPRTVNDGSCRPYGVNCISYKGRAKLEGM